jgi:DNA-binding NarL/FixJ family response regulator
MMLHRAEAAIKRALDGKFFKLAADGTVKMTKVERGFVPDHEAPRYYSPAQRGPRKFALFMPEEDGEIVEMVRAGKRPTAIALALDRKPSTISYRIDWLREKGLL